MDIRKLQRAIVDGLEDVKGQHIAVFNTEHLSSLFERVIIASGTSNRQTKSLASSVREAVKGAGFPVPRTEGEANGEWIVVDCGAAVVHVMQPTIREFYRLEEIWGDKPVKLRMGESTTKLVKASEAEGAGGEAATAPRKRIRARVPAETPRSTPPAKKAAAKKSPARPPVVMPAAPSKGSAAKKAPAKKTPQRIVTRVVGLKKVAAKKAASPAAKGAGRRPVAKKAAPRA